MPGSAEYNNDGVYYSSLYSKVTDAITSTSPYQPESDIFVKILNNNKEIIYDKINILTADIYGNCNNVRNIKLYREF